MQPYWQSDNGDTQLTIYQGDVLDVLRRLPSESVHCCITSPPYWGLRDYGVDGQIGLEPTPEEYVERLVEVFREVRRVLRDDGTLWLNLGDSYAVGGMSNPSGKSTLGGGKDRGASNYQISRRTEGLKPKDLVGIPWLVAFALRDDGWYLRSDIIWAKPNPMPESVTDRPTKAHEYIFLMSKSPRYYYDVDAIREPLVKGAAGSTFTEGKTGVNGLGRVSLLPRQDNPAGRNKRSVWTIATEPFPEAHFATFPTALVEPMVLAGCPAGGVVLDPFVGSGTTLLVAQRLGRSGIGIELNPDYCAMAQRRLEREHAQTRLPVGGGL